MNKNVEKSAQEYEKYVKSVTPTHSLGLQMLKAFLVGGAICLLGEVITNVALNYFELDQKTAGSWCSLILVLFAVLLTGFNLFSGLVKFGGAGALVPITGFANSVAAPAIEYQSEGQVFGIGCKIFTIAGPVILYGVFVSWLLGVLYYVGKMLGVV
jgi:stage V sporulation protein AC